MYAGLPGTAASGAPGTITATGWRSTPGEGNYTGASRKEFIATAFYAHSAQLLAQAMDALDMDGAAYHRLFETIRAAHQNAFPDCRTQTECALALHFGLAAAPDRVAAQLAELVRSNGNRLTTGFVGTPYLLHALSENGYAQTAYDLLLQTKAPSWLFSVKMGATTVWEPIGTAERRTARSGAQI